MAGGSHSKLGNQGQALIELTFSLMLVAMFFSFALASVQTLQSDQPTYRFGQKGVLANKAFRSQPAKHSKKF